MTASILRGCLLGSAFAAAVGIAALGAIPAAAGGLFKDRVHADSFGNLVIYSPSGYKRIIVGMGHTADAYNQTGSYYEPADGDVPEVVYYDDRDDRHVRRCHRPPHRFHGRSHMYGLPENVVPQAPLVCH